MTPPHLERVPTTPPANAAASELLLLGAILEQPRRFFEVMTLASSSDFFDLRGRLLYAALEQLDVEGNLLAAIEIAEERFKEAPKATTDERTAAGIARIRVVALMIATKLAQENKLGTMSVGQFADWSGALANNTPASFNLIETAHAIADMARVRLLDHACREIAQQTRGDVKDPCGVLDMALARVSALCMRHEESKNSATLAEVARTRFEQLRQDVEDRRNGIVRTVSTGFRMFDDVALGGMRDTELWVFAARSGGGKTALALNVATNAAAQGHGVLFYSLEMSDGLLHHRLLSSESGVPLKKIRKATLDDADWGPITQAEAFFERLPMTIDWQPNKPLQRLLSQAKRDARAWRSKHGDTRLRVIVVDYIGLVDTPHIAANAPRNQHVAQVAKALKGLATETNTCVIALAQMNRDIDKDKGKRAPVLSDLGESSGIEHAANLIAILRPEGAGERRPVKVHIIKQRDGSQGEFTLNYDGSIVRYFDPQWGDEF
jgi:replicative DNA helicase